MTIQEVSKIYANIMLMNSWANMAKVNHEGRRMFKYVSFKFDTRDGSIYAITLYNGNENYSFRLDDPNSLKRMYKFLGWE